MSEIDLCGSGFYADLLELPEVKAGPVRFKNVAVADGLLLDIVVDNMIPVGEIRAVRP